MKADLKELKGDMEKNRQERLWFVRHWANYVKTHPDKDWSKQQNVLINSMIQNAKRYPLTKEQYLEIKSKISHRK